MFGIEIQILNFPKYNYTARFDQTLSKDFFPDTLLGRRIDYFYQITPQGKFERIGKRIDETQNYSETFRNFDWLHPMLIRQRTEKEVQK